MSKADVKDERIREFFDEADDILGTMGKDVLKLGKGVKAGIIDPNVLNAIFRSAHTLKGMCGIFDYKDMAALSHSLEDTLDMLRLGRIALNAHVLDTIMAAHELLGKIVSSKGAVNYFNEIETLRKGFVSRDQERKAEGGTPIDSEIAAVLAEYEEHRLRENLKDGNNVFIINVSFPITNFDKGYMALTEQLKTAAEIIATLPSTKSSTDTLFFDILIGTRNDSDSILEMLKGLSVASLRVLSEMPSGGDAAKGDDTAVQARRDTVFEVIKGEGVVPEEDGKDTLRRNSNTVRVNIAKLDNIMNTISELTKLKSSISDLSAELKGERDFSIYGVKLARLEKYFDRRLSELRDGVLDLRMVPIGRLFGRFDTFLNRLSRETGKEIKITTYGAETELDKLIIEELADPLMHIIRNITDHGIEHPSIRESIGKPRAGSITLGARQNGNHVVVEVRDDGAGIDAAFIRAKALEKGLITEESAANLTDHDSLELIFFPGFSTKDMVDQTSGRGIGMDVVKDNITRLSGIIDIETAPGRGTSFILTIPVTLAIVQALLVGDAHERFAVPLNSVIEIVELDAAQLGRHALPETITVDGRDMSYIRLARFFGKECRDKDSYFGIIAGLAEHRLCILVEELIEDLDVVTKPLSKLFKVPGIAGATDMGEKGTVLVLDVTIILEMVIKESKTLVRV